MLNSSNWYGSMLRSPAWRNAAHTLSAVAARLRARPRGAPPDIVSTDGPLDAVNDDFHASYDAARQRACDDGPVFVVVADELVLFRCGERSAWSFSPRSFHVIKSVAHAPVALYALLQRSRAADVARLQAMRAQLTAAADSVAREELDAEPRRLLLAVLDACHALIDCSLNDGLDAARLDAFAAAVGPSLLRLIHEATRLQLAALHEHTEHALTTLSSDERAALHVVVTGDHQARERSLGMQYFQKRFAQQPGAEQRVTYAEGVSDEQGALRLVGTQRLDRKLARAFFGEETRLQRDLLGDAAAELLRSFSDCAIR